MKPGEIASLLPVGGPDAPYGVRRLRRCHSIEDLAHAARRRLPSAALAYLDGGGEGEYTLRRNRAAFDEVEVIPRVLRDVSGVETATSILGTPASTPIALAPVGAPRFLHHEGELAVARAAAGAGVPYAISTVGSVALEDVAREADGALWLQLYLWGDREAAKDLIDRAKGAGYQALLVTADVSVRSKRERELHAGLTLPSPDLPIWAILEAAMHPSWCWHFLTNDLPAFPNVRAGEDGPRRKLDLSGLFDGTVCWDDLAWITERWAGPVALKGVLSAEDARRAADAAVDAVIVSNHGGRQLDHVPATLDVLPTIADAVGDRVDVLLDSGIRRGSDVLTALALGARAVLVGRAYLYGLAAAGEPGVRRAIDILTGELRTAMALSGRTKLSELDRNLVRRRAQTSAVDTGRVDRKPGCLKGGV